MAKRYFTRNGIEVQPYRPLPWPKSGPMNVHRTEGERQYRLCQVLPPLPQRFEWINEANLKVREEGAPTGALAQ